MATRFTNANGKIKRRAPKKLCPCHTRATLALRSYCDKRNRKKGWNRSEIALRLFCAAQNKRRPSALSCAHGAHNSFLLRPQCDLKMMCALLLRFVKFYDRSMNAVRAQLWCDRGIRSARGHDSRITPKHSKRDYRLNFFTVSVIPVWNKLPQDIIHAESLRQFKIRLRSFLLSQPSFPSFSWHSVTLLSLSFLFFYWRLHRSWCSSCLLFLPFLVFFSLLLCFFFNFAWTWARPLLFSLFSPCLPLPPAQRVVFCSWLFMYCSLCFALEKGLMK